MSDWSYYCLRFADEAQWLAYGEKLGLLQRVPGDMVMAEGPLVPGPNVWDETVWNEEEGSFGAYVPELDKDGKPIMEPSWVPVLDKDGNPTYAPDTLVPQSSHTLTTTVLGLLYRPTLADPEVMEQSEGWHVNIASKDALSDALATFVVKPEVPKCSYDTTKTPLDAKKIPDAKIYGFAVTAQVLDDLADGKVVPALKPVKPSGRDVGKVADVKPVGEDPIKDDPIAEEKP